MIDENENAVKDFDYVINIYHQKESQERSCPFQKSLQSKSFEELCPSG